MERSQQRNDAPDILTAEGFGTAVKRIERLLFAASYSILGNCFENSFEDALSDSFHGCLTRLTASIGVQQTIDQCYFP